MNGRTAAPVSTAVAWQARVAGAQRHSAVVLPLAILLAVVAAALLAPYLAPHNPVRGDLRLILLPPAWQSGGAQEYLLGTDALGRDVLSRIVYGARVSLIVAFTAVVIGGSFGTFVGLISGFLGGRVDTLLMRFVDVQLSIPYIMLAIGLVGVIGPSVGNIILVIAVTDWLQFARVVRGETLKVKQAEFVDLARICGCSTWRILRLHVLPNVFNAVIVVATLAVGRAIIMESSLSFLGLGIQPPTPSWGLMLADARQFVATSWWLITFPGMALAATVLAVNLLGDWLRDALDPRMAR